MERREFVLLCFDIPMKTPSDRRAYHRFQKYLKRSGYHRMQKSVYIKLLPSGDNLGRELSLTKEAAPNGTVYALPLTFRHLQRMTALRGNSFDYTLVTDEILSC